MQNITVNMLNRRARSQAQAPMRKNSVEYRLIYALAFLIFLVAGSVWYVISLSFVRDSDERYGPRSSPLSEARAAANSSVPYVFQSQ